MRKNPDLHRSGPWNRKSDHHKDPPFSLLDLRSRPEICSQKIPPRFIGRHSDMPRLQELKLPNQHVPLPPPSIPPSELLPRSLSHVAKPYLHQLT